MLKEQVWQLLSLIPEKDLTKTVLILKSGLSINIDTVFRKESEYMTIRGREAGSNDEGRVFFLPYEEISYIKIERLVRLNELRKMYGEAAQVAGLADADDEEIEEVQPQKSTTDTPAPTPAPISGPQDPAAIAKANLLERIRQARTAANKK